MTPSKGQSFGGFTPLGASILMQRVAPPGQTRQWRRTNTPDPRHPFTQAIVLSPRAAGDEVRLSPWGVVLAAGPLCELVKQGDVVLLAKAWGGHDVRVGEVGHPTEAHLCLVNESLVGAVLE